MISSKEDQRSITEQLDDMLESAKIEPELIASLGDGMRSLSDQAKQMGQITGAASATNEYANSLKDASVKVSELSDSYARASESLVGLTAQRGRRQERRREPEQDEHQPHRAERDVRDATAQQPREA
jgi:hypothetical protein